jgi:hypothetical protein
MTTPRVAFGATPLGGGRHQRPGKAGSSVSLDEGTALLGVVSIPESPSALPLDRT